MSSSGGFQGADVEQLRDGGDAVAGGSQRLRALGDRTLTQWSGIHGRAWFGPDADGMDQIVREAARGIAEAAEALRDL
ncbi:MAG: hypothetical protein Q4G40_12075, partial [Brachybacterium sp.]|nr:hypothetical protein [Brachybacterium sp.]